MASNTSGAFLAFQKGRCVNLQLYSYLLRVNKRSTNTFLFCLHLIQFVNSFWFAANVFGSGLTEMSLKSQVFLHEYHSKVELQSQKYQKPMQNEVYEMFSKFKQVNSKYNVTKFGGKLVGTI
jgi:hypothetical protein